MVYSDQSKKVLYSIWPWSLPKDLPSSLKYLKTTSSINQAYVDIVSMFLHGKFRVSPTRSTKKTIKNPDLVEQLSHYPRGLLDGETSPIEELLVVNWRSQFHTISRNICPIGESWNTLPKHNHCSRHLGYTNSNKLFFTYSRWSQQEPASCWQTQTFILVPITVPQSMLLSVLPKYV